MFASVIIEYGAKKISRMWTYKIPERLQNVIKVGMKVYVPFGVQKIHGFVLDIFPTYQNDIELKEIIDVVDPYLILDKELLDLGKYLSETTLVSLSCAYQAMLPTSLKAKTQKHNYALYDEYIYLINKDNALEYINKYPKRTSQIKVINDLLKSTYINKKEYSSNTIKELLNNNIISIKKETKYRINKNNTRHINELTKDQQDVYNQVISNEYNTYLLYGITGSGKTEVYIKLIDRIIKEGKTAIMLVPEISLTTQIANRFYNAFASDVAILHSSLSDGEKYDEYLKILRGEVHVVVGTRSAIFAPLKNLGIIIIDEEDSTSYKQDSNPRYHARDMAIYRAKYNNIPVVLGSATPSLESMARASKGVYKLLTLDKRVGNAVLPTINIVDMTPEMKKRNTIFSDYLLNKIKEKIEKKEQVILLLNRRGFATFITCSNCGYTYKCPNCDITLTYHKTTNNLMCHYCGYQKKKDNACPSCGEEALNYYGLGTERLEEKILELIPNARIVRMDQDTTRNKGTHEKIINDFKDYKYDILLGTQMISKGLDFPKVTLVGVINADTSLNIPDYRSGENTFTLLHQVAGRAGRSDLLGEVVIQTFNPDNHVFSYIKDNNYKGFYNYEMNFRHKLKYPPYYYLVSIRVIDKSYETTMDEAKKVKKYLETNLTNTSIVLGPTTCSVFKYYNEYRMQIIIKYQYDDKLMPVLKDLDNIYINKNTKLEIDFNPLKI